MSDTIDLFDTVFDDALKEARKHEISTNEASVAIKNLKVLSECLPPKTETESNPEPETVLGKIKVVASGVWDNETTRVLIKAGGAFAGVALVAWTTIHRDHVMAREALSQANQRFG